MSELNTPSLADIQAKIENAKQLSRFYPQDVTLLAVSKTRPSTKIRALYQQGIHSFGENYLQEALAKQKELADCDIDWHFIGPIQSNKTQQIAGNFHWVHSVDRLKIAQRLSGQRPADLPPMQCCVQINIDGEETKSGILAADLLPFLQQCQDLKNIQIRGLMCIPEPKEDQTSTFRKMRELLELANENGFELDTLSMGMSADFEVAIAEGATIVRLGTVLFGSRN